MCKKITLMKTIIRVICIIFVFLHEYVDKTTLNINKLNITKPTNKLTSITTETL